MTEVIRYEAVVGLEVHVELDTASKIFCGCPTRFGAEPNTQVCPVCLGMPGTLPVLNGRALELLVRAGLSLSCTVAPHAKFDRKSYFYPDLPKGYQISQYDRPVCVDGHLDVPVDGRVRRVRVQRVHLEEDAGKLLHLGRTGQIGDSTASLVDFNRAGVPLAEIVSHPDIRSPEEAVAYLTLLRRAMRYAGVSDCNMEQGSLRCDANVSLRPSGEERLGAKVEVKNLNSFKFLKDAISFEIVRQAEQLDRGERVRQETRLFDARTGETVPMRSKEEAHDYRYFPEPDLPPMRPDAAWVAAVRLALPEMPWTRQARFEERYALSPYDASVLTAERALADYFEAVVSAGGAPKAAANWVTTELAGALHEAGKTIEDCPVSPASLARLVSMVADGETSGKIGKIVFAEMFASGRDPKAIVAEQGLVTVTDEAEIARLVERALAENPDAASQYRAGKERALGHLVGCVMRYSGGRASPPLVNRALRDRLGPPGA